MIVLYTKQSLILDLCEMGIEPTDTLFVHSSMKSIGQVENGANAVVDALCEYMSNGLLVMPAHTWSYVNNDNPIFDVRNSETCVGILTELFRQRQGVNRTLHPTHSLSAIGSDAKEFVNGQELFDTPCAPNSCYEKLEKRNAKVLLVGVDFSKNTLVHCIEEVAQVPKRLSDSHEQLFAIDYDGKKISVPSRRHEDADSYRYVKLEPIMISRGMMKQTRFGDARCMLYNVSDLFSLTLELLSKNIRLFDDFTPVPTDWF